MQPEFIMSKCLHWQDFSSQTLCEKMCKLHAPIVGQYETRIGKLIQDTIVHLQNIMIK